MPPLDVMSDCNFLFSFCKFFLFDADSVGTAQLDTLSAPGDREVTKGKKMGKRSNQKKSGQSLLFSLQNLERSWSVAFLVCLGPFGICLICLFQLAVVISSPR